MEKVTTKAPLFIHSGIVGLTEAQAAVRMHRLVKLTKQPELPDDVTGFEVQAELQFKAGETFYLKDVPKNLRPRLAGNDDKGAEDSKGDNDNSANNKKSSSDSEEGGANGDKKSNKKDK